MTRPAPAPVRAPAPPAPRPGAEGGFVMIAVVMFVLALTILGLTLFSLSSYEAQFLHRSIDGERAFQAAAGALERAKFTLASTRRLESVRALAGSGGIVAASARQLQGGVPVDSGEVAWSGDDVHLEVTVASGEVTRTLRAEFSPAGPESWYQRLFTVSGTIDATTWAAGRPQQAGRVRLEGAVWHETGDASWLAGVQWPTPDSLRVGGVARPADSLFILDRLLDSVVPDTQRVDATTLRVDFPVASANPVYYAGPVRGGTPWTFAGSAGERIELRVQGLAVWLLEGGLVAEDRVEVRRSGSGTALLVIVGGPPAGSDVGLAFGGGLDSEIPVVLVSRGRVRLVQLAAWESGTAIPGLSVFAGGLDLLGPAAPAEMDLRYDRAAMDPLIRALEATGALPNSGGALGRAFTMRPGSWQASGD